MKFAKAFFTTLAAALSCLLEATPTFAAPLAKTPGATLIVPYFEVDLDAADGRSTLISVGNAGDRVIARATLWSDWGVPVYAWDIYLGENAVATYNLRDILVHGRVAPTRAPALFGNCGDPVFTPALSAADLALLQKKLTGQNLGGGQCASAPRDDASLATGSLTIDTVTECRAGASRLYPNDASYFYGSRALASPRKVLWGDFTLVDPAENFATGFEAIALGLAENVSSTRFGDWRGNPGIAREALDNPEDCSRIRFLQGGPFAARTSLFVYTPPPQFSNTAECDIGVLGPTVWDFYSFTEDGLLQGFKRMPRGPGLSGRIEVGPTLGVVGAAGYLEVVTYESGDWGGVPEPGQPIQHLLLGAIQASGRFAVSQSGNVCR